MRFFLSRYPDGLGPEEHPGGFPFVNLQFGTEVLEIRGLEGPDDNAFRCIENQTFDEKAESLMKSCWHFFAPPLILAGLDVHHFYRCSSAKLKTPSLDSLRRDFETAVLFYIEENNSKGFPFVRVIDSDGDVEMPDDFWVWVIGYFPHEDKALVLNLNKFHDFLPISALDVSSEYIKERFQNTPNYRLPSSRLPADFVPDSLGGRPLDRS